MPAPASASCWRDGLHTVIDADEPKAREPRDPSPRQPLPGGGGRGMTSSCLDPSSKTTQHNVDKQSGTRSTSKRIIRDCVGWSIDAGSDCAVTWSEMPAVLEKLILGLFSARPDDPLSWIHNAIWQLHAEELSRHNAIEDMLESVPSHRSHSVASCQVAPTNRTTQSPKSIGQGSSQRSFRSVTRFSSRSDVTSRGSRLPSMGEEAIETVDISPSTMLPKQPFHRATISGQVEVVGLSDGCGDKGLRSSVNHILKLGAANVRREAADDEDVGRDSDKNSKEYGKPSLGEQNFARYFGKKHTGELTSRSQKKVTTSTAGQLKLAETSQEKAPERCIFSPVGRVRITWDFAFFICLLFEVWATPMELVFFPDSVENEHIPSWFRIVSLSVLSFFCCDVVMNFSTGFVQDGVIVMERRRIAMAYIKSWFWFDLMATLPEVLTASFGNTLFFVRVSRGMKTYKMMRALRISRAMRLVSSGEANMIMRHFEFSPRFEVGVKMVQANVLLLLLVHVHGSVWAALQPASWKAQEAEDAYGKYYESLWAVFPGLTFGGELPVSNEGQHLLAIIVGMERITYLILCAKWLLWRAFLQQMDAEHQQALDGALAYLKFHRVSPALQLKVFQSLREIRRVQKRQHQFDKLSATHFAPQLKRLISDELWSEKLLSIDLIHYVASWEAEVVRELALQVREMIIASKVVVFSAGEPSSTAYLVLRGALAVTYHEMDSETPDYLAGMWVGEQALVNSELRRIQTVVSKVLTQLMALEAADFQAIMDEFNLKERYGKLLRDQLWLGLCGRCGILGDHFNHDCPLLSEAPSHFSSRFLVTQNTAQSKLRSQRQLLRETGISRKDDSMAELHRFLADQNLSRMKDVMTRYGVMSLNDMKLSTIEAIHADPEVQLSQSERELLSMVSIKEFRRHVKKVCTQILSTSEDENNYFVFISHYKVEAGTEAALIQEDMRKIIDEDQTSPGHALKAAIFLDTENLRDLNDLKHHITRSHNVVLLLTPGVLSRPWCLVEIVAAMKAGVHIVPVEVQRKDLTFTYPDEAYFQRIRHGKELDPGALKLIHREGIDNYALEAALRKVFMLIALPFSPHKTTRIRQAELQDVLNECSVRDDLAGRRSIRPSSLDGDEDDWKPIMSEEFLGSVRDED